MADLSLQYIAGIVDGEGTIDINRRRPSHCNRLKSEEYCLRVGVVNTYLPLMHLLKAQFGGSLSSRQPQLNHKVCYSWALVSKQAETFLSLVAPYLVVKRAQAELGLEFRRSRTNTASTKLGTSIGETTLRESFYLAMRKLNGG